ncbi:GerMN domain-containing protein [Limnochorda pilosa]|uniref:GerMN domain-containing protein n=1 Tax=Limnochorda pilosa TaxID=1555112 RepID=UPI0011873453|nr:GerMN domain-containing protein [Limnochorda pilosa]
MEYDATRGWRLLAVLLFLAGLVALGLLGERWQAGIDRRLAPDEEVLVYYATQDAMGLVGLPTRLPREQVTPEGVLDALFSGARRRGDYVNPIPMGGRVQWVQVSGPVATVSLNQALVDNHPGGSAGELLTVYGIVETLTQLPGIQRVQLLVEGQRVESLKGHVDLTRPLAPDPGRIVQRRAERLQTGTPPAEGP